MNLKLRNDNGFSVFHSGFMGANPRRRYIAAKDLVDPRLSLFNDTAYKFVHKVRMRAVMAAARALLEGILRIEGVEITANGIFSDLGWQGLIEVGHLHLTKPGRSAAVLLNLTDLGDVGGVAVGEAPLKRLLATVYVHPFQIHTGGLEQRTGRLALHARRVIPYSCGDYIPILWIEQKKASLLTCFFLVVTEQNYNRRCCGQPFWFLFSFHSGILP